jgi:hypothetical protein
MTTSWFFWIPGREVGRRFREWNRLVLHLLPGLEGVFELVLLFDALDGAEHELADIGEGAGSAPGDAILGEGDIELA